MIKNPVSILDQTANNTQINPTRPGQTSILTDPSSNSHALNSPAKLPISSPAGTAINQISSELVGNSFGLAAPTTISASSNANSSTNPANPITAPNAAANLTSTWSKVALQSGPSQTIEPTKTLDSFQQFKKQAKEKMDKEKLIEMQEQKRRDREQAERDRLAQEQKIDQEGEMALNSLARCEQSPVLSPASDSQSPASGAGTSGDGSSMLRLREQERRRREALVAQNQMDLSRQSEIMSKFEDRV